MANIPKFFLKQQEDGGFMSKFVAEIPAKANPDSPAGASPAGQTEARKVAVSKYDQPIAFSVISKQLFQNLLELRNWC